MISMWSWLGRDAKKRNVELRRGISSKRGHLPFYNAKGIFLWYDNVYVTIQVWVELQELRANTLLHGRL